jgi:hypothetical protein
MARSLLPLLHRRKVVSEFIELLAPIAYINRLESTDKSIMAMKNYRFHRGRSLIYGCNHFFDFFGEFKGDKIIGWIEVVFA